MRDDVEAGMTASQILLAGRRDNWTRETARLAMPLLLRCAIDGRTITYRELDVALYATHGRARMPVLPVYGHPAGRIGDVCAVLEHEIGRRVPPLNAILVNRSGTPGHGADYYLRRAAGRTRGRLGSAGRRSLALATIDAVHAFEGWRKVAEHLGLRIPPSIRSPDEPLALPAATGRTPAGPESEAHRQLKERVRSRPSFFRAYGHFRGAPHVERQGRCPVRIQIGIPSGCGGQDLKRPGSRARQRRFPSPEVSRDVTGDAGGGGAVAPS